MVNRCCMCKTAAESVDHLFIHCPMAKEFWDKVLSLFGVSWVMPCQVRGLIDCWQRGLLRHQFSSIWKALPHCLMWCLWRERNMRSFENTELGSLDLKLLFLRTLYDWIPVLGLFSVSSLQDFLVSCNSFELQVYAQYTCCFLFNKTILFIKKKEKRKENTQVLSFI